MGEGALCPSAIYEAKAAIFVGHITRSCFDEVAVEAGCYSTAFALLFNELVDCPHNSSPYVVDALEMHGISLRLSSSDLVSRLFEVYI